MLVYCSNLIALIGLITIAIYFGNTPPTEGEKKIVEMLQHAIDPTLNK